MNDIRKWLTELEHRSVPGGGFAGQPGGSYRPDATAWAALALESWKECLPQVAAARDRLVASQFKDGRVAIDPTYPQAFWPTAEAILLWHGSPSHQSALKRAVDFLLRTSGVHYRWKPNDVVGHDTSIKGWPWIEKTHSWVEPTAMNLLALELTGHSGHTRAQEARQMLLNRQLESGGWNYGNTKTYCLELRPSMESTGLALHALAEHVEEKDVRSSLAYLEAELPKTRTPLWLGWSLLGMSAWKRRPQEAEEWIVESLERQSDYGSYDTAWIGLLLVAAWSKQGVIDALKRLETAGAS